MAARGSRRLNRLAIIHGSARRYGTHATALRLFLLLVALAETLDVYEEERRRPDPELGGASRSESPGSRLAWWNRMQPLQRDSRTAPKS